MIGTLQFECAIGLLGHVIFYCLLDGDFERELQFLEKFFGLMNDQGLQVLCALSERKWWNNQPRIFPDLMRRFLSDRSDSRGSLARCWVVKASKKSPDFRVSGWWIVINQWVRNLLVHYILRSSQCCWQDRWCLFSCYIEGSVNFLL